MRAVEGNLGHSLQYKEGEEGEERKEREAYRFPVLAQRAVATPLVGRAHGGKRYAAPHNAGQKKRKRARGKPWTRQTLEK